VDPRRMPMPFAVFFEDAPERADQRAAHMPAHLAFLQAHADVISAAGPLVAAAGLGAGPHPAPGTPAGGLWNVTAGDAAVVRRLVEADPFWPTGLRRSVRILDWRQVFAEGRALPQG
ncbi:MAG: YciI family protein, partial [Pseudomonadota bacterium]